MNKASISLISILISISSFAQTDLATKPFSIGINPTYPLFKGYGVKAFYNLQKHWSVGILSEGGFNLPEFAEEQFFTNAENIDVNWDYSAGIEVRYRFYQKDWQIKGPYTFGTFGYENWTIESADIPSHSDQFDNWFASVGFGWNFFPLKKHGLWVGASYNVIFILNNTSDKQLNGSDYHLRPVIPPSLLPNLYVGWQF